MADYWEILVRENLWIYLFFEEGSREIGKRKESKLLDLGNLRNPIDCWLVK
ncbi:MAG: hypothetical protein AB4080_13940 [Trichodesmium sp.]